jgi:hypothetical protein
MDRTPLDVSPVAKFLVGLVEQRASGSVQLPPRSVLLAGGDVVDITSAAGDPDIGEFALRSGRINAATLSRAREQAQVGDLPFEQALMAHSKVSAGELRMLRRSLLLDRFVRSLRPYFDGDLPLPVLLPSAPRGPAANSGEATRFLPLILDALGRIAHASDAAAVGSRLNHRFSWLAVPLVAEAKRWASLGDTPERAVVSALLARLPACAPQLAALLRCGFARLSAPGRTPTRSLSKTGTLPPPAPRLSMMIEPAPRPTPRPEPPLPPTAAERAERGPRLQLEPGGSGVPIEAIPSIAAKAWPHAREAPHDPLRELELWLANQAGTPPRRAQTYVALAKLWEERIGSLEEATRALREAVAADPDDAALMDLAAGSCFRLGQGELAVRYASAAVLATPEASERARRYQLIARCEQARGRLDNCIQALSEAAAEYPEEPAPHESMAQILADRDQLPLAAAHARMAASYYAAREPERALTLHALAYGWHPIDAQLAAEYGSALEAHGRPEAAVAVLAQTARNLSGRERRAALEQAARLAEHHDRRDLRAELLLEIYDEDPSYIAIHAGLDASLDRPGLEAEHAALLEVLARRCSDARKPSLLVRAGEALARIDGERQASLRHLWLAWQLDESALSKEQFERLVATGSDLNTWPLDPGSLIQALDAELLAAASGKDQPLLLGRLAALRAERGDSRGVASACLRLLSIQPDHAMAAARLWRAAADLPDAVLRREALIWLGRMRAGREQGRALAVLSRQLENMADFDGAVSSAEAALEQDDTAADAAMIALRHVHRLEPARAVTLLRRARTLLAGPPLLLLSMAEAAAAGADRDTQQQALAELSAALPFLFQPRARALEALLTEADSEAIRQQSEALLEHCAGPEVFELARSAVARLAELGENAVAARLAERVMCCQGQIDPADADRALQLARRTGDAALLRAALERAASVHEGAARLDCLLQLAAQHRAQGDAVAEVRALLRALPLPDEQRRALARLTDCFAEQGDKDRLLTVLTLRLDATRDPDARRAQLFDMACAARTYGDDRAAVAEYMSALIKESVSERHWLLFALGGLFTLGDAAWATGTAREIAQNLAPEVSGVIYLWLAHKAELEGDSTELAMQLAAEGARRFTSVGELLLLAERLTLAAHDKRCALGLYTDLLAAAMGPHGRRALHYRAGRWLERAGEPGEALTHYQRAFELAPGAGVAFVALERAARTARQLHVLVDAQRVLAATLRDERARSELLESAARSCLHDLDDPARALEILLEADVFAPPGRLDPLLQEALEALTRRDQAAARGALESVLHAREARAEQLWHGEVKAELLLSMARMRLSVGAEPATALEAFERVLTTDLRESLNSQALAAGLRDFAQLLFACGRADEAEAALSEARVLAPELVQAHALRDAFAATGAANQTGAAPSSQPAAPARSPASEEQLRARAATGDVDALAELVAVVRGDASRREEAHALLGQLVRIAPERTAALRTLYSDALASGAQAEARVCAQILALFEPSIARPERIPFQAADLRSDEVFEIVYVGQNAELAQLLQLTWEHAQAIPQLRRTPETLSLGQPIAASENTPLALAYLRACQMLRREPGPVYLKAGAFPEVGVVPTHPLSIVVRSGAVDPLGLEFLLARALVFSEPHCALLCALPESEGRALLAAVASACGVASGARPLSRRQKELTSELWQTIPTRIQSEMRELLAANAAEFDYDALRTHAEQCGLRAGLLVASDPGCALETLARTDDALRECDVHSEAGFARACQLSADFREIIRSALSLPYVGLTALALESAA